MRIQRYVLKLGGLSMACSGGLAVAGGGVGVAPDRVERQIIDGGQTGDAIVPDAGLLDATGSPLGAIPTLIPGVEALSSGIPSILGIGSTSGGISNSASQIPTVISATPRTTLTPTPTATPTTVTSPDSTPPTAIVPPPQPSSTSQAPAPESVSTSSISPIFTPPPSTSTSSSISTPPTTTKPSAAHTIIPPAVVPVPLPSSSTPSSSSPSSTAPSSAPSSSIPVAQSDEAAPSSSSSSSSLISRRPQDSSRTTSSYLPSDTTSSNTPAETLPPGSDPIAVPQQVMPPRSMRSATIAICIVSIVAGTLAIATIAYYLMRRHLRRRPRSPESPPPTPSLDEKQFHNRQLSGSTLQSAIVEVASARHDGGFGFMEKESGLSYNPTTRPAEGTNTFTDFKFGESWPLSSHPIPGNNMNIHNGDQATREDMAIKSVVGRVHDPVEDNSADESRSVSSLSSSASVKSKNKAKLSLFPMDGAKRKRTLASGEVVGVASNF